MDGATGWLDGNGDVDRTLVVVFLRGAADGLNLVVPVDDDDYHRARPTIGLKKSETLVLDGFFGLNPMLASLKPIYDAGDLAIVHAAGSEDQTRSHFEAQDLMEHGGTSGGGWLARHLRFRSEPATGALAAIALGRTLPECLRGAPAATVMQSPEDFSLGEGSEALSRELAKLYAPEQGPLGLAAHDTIEALGRIDAMRGKPYRPVTEYPQDDFGAGLMQVARLIKAKVGLQAVAVDLGGWDSHFAQSSLIGPLMTRLAGGLSAFRADLGPMAARTTVCVMTEFGRRVAENSALGTDHGRGGAMFIMGGGVAGGRVIAHWPGLAEDKLEGPGDVAVTTNYRDVLAPILLKHGAAGAEGLSKVFPGAEIKPVGIYG